MEPGGRMAGLGEGSGCWRGTRTGKGKKGRGGEARQGQEAGKSGVKGLRRGRAAAAADAGAQRGQDEPSELQWRSESPTFLWNSVFTLCSSPGGGSEEDDTQGRKSSPRDAPFGEGASSLTAKSPSWPHPPLPFKSASCAFDERSFPNK